MTAREVALYRAAFAALGRWPARGWLGVPMCDAERAARAAERERIMREHAR